MLDRASTFAHPEIVQLLKTRFVPVAIDQANQRRQKDTEGEFYRKIAAQGPRNLFDQTTQGFYIATPSGELLLYNNNRDPQKLLRLMKETLAEFESDKAVDFEAVETKTVDKRYSFSAPEGGLVIRVRAKVLGGYEPTQDRWKRIFQSAVSRDNLWVSAAEHQALVRGEFLPSLQMRLARFHLVDNTRGEPKMWKPDEVRRVSLKIDEDEITGTASMKTSESEKKYPRGFEATLRGVVEVTDGEVTRFDLVALGDCWGNGPYTGGAPEGRFPLVITFTLADGSDTADRLPPQASRGWLEGYIKTTSP